MRKADNTQGKPLAAGYVRMRLVLLWLALSTGWLVSIFSVIEEMCLATACRDTAGFTLFGVNIGLFGIAYFSVMLILMQLRQKNQKFDMALFYMVFAGIGAELRLLWIQKYIIGSWCPLCIIICCSLFITAFLLIVEKLQGGGGGQSGDRSSLGWLAIAATCIVIGLVISIVGVKALI